MKNKGLYNREVLSSTIPRFVLKEILVFLGIRRSDISTLRKLLINHLLKKTDCRKILYINLDDPYYSGVNKDPKNLYRIIETAEKLTVEKTAYLFLDENQNVRDWEKWVKSAYDNEIYQKIFVTGSNSIQNLI